jgi:hypothetical protein
LNQLRAIGVKLLASRKSLKLKSLTEESKMDGEESKMDTQDYCPICAEAIVLQLRELEPHSCLDTDAVQATEFEAARDETRDETREEAVVVAVANPSTTCTDEQPNTDEQPGAAFANLRNIWARQLTTRQDRVLHGHFEGDLARHLQPVLAHVISR